MGQRMGRMTDDQKAHELAKLVGKARRSNKDSANLIILVIIFGALGYFAFNNIPGAILSGLLAGLVKGTHTAVLVEIWQSEIRAIHRTYEGDNETVNLAIQTEKTING